MIRIPLSLEDWAFLLNPRFSDFGSIWQVVLLVLFAVVPIALLLILYRYELRLVRWFTAFLMFSMRFAVVLVLWFVIAFQPVFSRTSWDELPSRVVVLLDQSLSMDVADPQRSALEKLQLAQFTGQWQQHRSQLAVWIKQYEAAGAAPTWNDSKEKALHDTILAAMDKMTRQDLTRAILTEQGANVFESLKAKHKVDVLAFHKSVFDVSKNLKQDKQAALDIHFTDMQSPLAKALLRSSQQGRTLAVLLFSDGRHNWGKTPVAEVTKPRRRKVPIYPIQIGSDKEPPDIALTQFDVRPTNILLGADANIQAQFRVAGLPAQDIVVELRANGKLLQKDHRKIVKHDGSNRRYIVRFQAKLEEVKTHKLEVQVKPAQNLTNEISAGNNARSVAVRVAKDKARVLLVDGAGRWEHHYLYQALHRDEIIKPEAVLFTQPRIGMLSDKALKQSGHPLTRLPEWKDRDNNPDPLHDYACIVLGDVSPEKLPLSERRRLARYVADSGGTLVMVAGKNYMPRAYARLRLPNQLLDPLGRMLPITDVRDLRPEDGFRVSLTHDGQLKSYLHMEATAAASAKTWRDLPAHYFAMIGQAKPGATSLAFVKRALDDVKDKGDPERERALMVTQNYGFGRVLYVGLDSTWRWRYRRGDLYHHRFWGQLIRWAASDRILPAGNKYVRYGATQPAWSQDEPIDIHVRLEEQSVKLSSKAHAKVRILRVDENEKTKEVTRVDLKADPFRPRLLKAKVSDLPPGSYRMQLDIPDLSAKLPSATENDTNRSRRDTFLVLPSESGELLNLSINKNLLQTLAQKSGGELLKPAQLPALLQRLTQQIDKRPRYQEKKIWEDPPMIWYLLGGVLVLLSFEWTTRKLVGLA